MKGRTHVLMLFLDGVGIGKGNGRYNPFFSAEMNCLRELIGGKMFDLGNKRFDAGTSSVTALNATLGIGGLPQSGTNQTALITGINAPRCIKKHFGPYLYSSLRETVVKENIFRKLQLRGLRTYYANAYPRQYFEYLRSPKYRPTVFPFAWLSAGNELNGSEALLSGRAVSADITNERWSGLGYSDMPVISPREAGRRLVKMTREYDFVLYEFFFTDHAGHSESMTEALKILGPLDLLFGGIMDEFDREKMLLVITSDHGNIEDISTRSHTRNPVPLIAAGSRHREVTSGPQKITDVAPALLNMLD